MKRTLFLSAVMAGLLFASCKKSSNNGYVTSTNQPTMSYEIKATNANYSMDRTTATANVVWDSAFATPDVIVFEATQGNVQVQYKATNTQEINLMAPTALDFGNFSLPAGTYTDVTLKIDLDKMGNTPVLQLNGSVTDGTVTLPVELLVNESVQLQTEQDSVTITTDSSFVAVTTLDLSSITTGITATMLLNARLTDGTIVLSSSSNENLYRMILNNLGNKRHHCDFEHGRGHH